MWKFIGFDGFACGFRFWTNFFCSFAVLEGTLWQWKGDVKEQEQPVWNRYLRQLPTRYLRQLPTRFRNLRFWFIDELLQF